MMQRNLTAWLDRVLTRLALEQVRRPIRPVRVPLPWYLLVPPVRPATRAPA